MPRKRSLPSAAKRIGLLEDGIADLLPLLHEKACEFIPRLGKTPLEHWCLFAGASFFYSVSHSIATFITPVQWKRLEPSYRALLSDFATDFGDVQGEIAGLHKAVLALREKNPTVKPEDGVQDVIIMAGLWPLQRSLRWKQMPRKHTPLVAVLGNLIWENGAAWFDPGSDPTADTANDLDIEMAILETMQRIARGWESEAGRIADA